VVTRDRVFLEGLMFYAFHGVNPEEKVLGQRFVVDVSFSRDLRAAGKSDDLSQTTSYSAVYKQVRDIVQSGPYDLIETVAEKIATAILGTYTEVEEVRVAVRKPDVAIKGSILSAVGVEIQRTRGE